MSSQQQQQQQQQQNRQAGIDHLHPDHDNTSQQQQQQQQQQRDFLPFKPPLVSTQLRFLIDIGSKAGMFNIPNFFKTI
jgi:hypothetical protein